MIADRYRRTFHREIASPTGTPAGRLHLTPDMIEAAYVFLRSMPPFHCWKLPEPDHVRFVVTLSVVDYAFARAARNGNPWEIGVSCRLVRSSQALIETVAHEMCHLRADALGCRGKHGRRWQRAAASVCRYHGFSRQHF